MPASLPEPPRWDSVISLWYLTCSHLGLSPTRCTQFLDVRIKPPRADEFPPEVIDWWPTELIEQRKTELDRRGNRSQFILFHRGSLAYRDTAASLWECRNNLGDALAVWVAALTWPRRERPLDEETGFDSAAGRKLQELAYLRMGEVGVDLWHHKTVYTLPLNPLNRHFERCICRPDLYALTHVSALCIHTCLSTWQLVRVINEEVESGDQPQKSSKIVC